MTGEENIQDFYNFAVSNMPQGCQVIGKGVKQNGCYFTLKVKIPFAMSSRERDDLNNKLWTYFEDVTKGKPLPSYEVERYDYNRKTYYKEVRKIDNGDYSYLHIEFTVAKGSVKVTWANFEQVVTERNDDTAGRFFFPKSDSRYRDGFSKSISVGYILPDGTHRIYVIAAPKAILTKMSNLLDEGKTPIEVIESLNPTVIVWKE